MCDRFNNRVLIWHSLPTQWNALPDLVLGQKNFITNNPDTSKSGLNFPGNVSVGANGVVTIADTENDRILIWLQFPTQNGQAADVSINLRNISNHLEPWPWGVWTDGTKLAVAATRAAKLLFWNTLPTTDNQVFDYSISLSNFGTPRNISTDGVSYFFVGDHNAKVNDNIPGTFFWNSYPTQTNQPYDFFISNEGWIKGVKLPDGKLVAGGLNSLYIWNTFPTSTTPASLSVFNNYYSNGDGVDVVYAGDRLYVNNYNGNNVQVYNSIPTESNQLPDFAIGSPAISVNTLDSINYIQNPVVATDGNVLIASSDLFRTIWIWQTVTPVSGQAPDVKINLREINLDFQPFDNALHNGHFVVAGEKKVAIWNSIPLNGQFPSYVFTNSIGNVQFQNLRGVALDDNYFYLADDGGKISIWQGLPTTGTEQPFVTIMLPGHSVKNLHSDGTYLCFTETSTIPTVYIYRVSDIEQGGSVQPFKTITNSQELPLNLPNSAITFNGSIAIANTGGNAVWLWKNIADVGDPGKVIILGQPSINSSESGIGVKRLFMPAYLAAHGPYLWVGETKFSSRILRFNDGNLTSVEPDEGDAVVPDDFVLEQNYPNPFNPSTTIKYSVPGNEKREMKNVKITVYDVLGNEVATLVNEQKPAGNYEVKFDGNNLSSGIYFYKLQSGSFVETKKMILLK